MLLPNIAEPPLFCLSIKQSYFNSEPDNVFCLRRISCRTFDCAALKKEKENKTWIIQRDAHSARSYFYWASFARVSQCSLRFSVFLINACSRSFLVSLFTCWCLRQRTWLASVSHVRIGATTAFLYLPRELYRPYCIIVSHKTTIIPVIGRYAFFSAPVEFAKPHLGRC